ncbi:hypothetical protein RQP53_23235 [Paucibacter sp. APW11]|uniref:Secreted protein n=1 Tax=Roseateles aquae TaxID=3077235 RepID=A0ABU3PI30_9BURK|nr:hypothetical protein [Paucibacter sp. APW11]MDT9002213.1 hypothetical protein [Paucibacter sp. APW11]
MRIDVPARLLLICLLALLLPLQGVAASLSMTAGLLARAAPTASAPSLPPPSASTGRSHCEELVANTDQRSDQDWADTHHATAQKPSPGCGSCAHCCLAAPPPAEITRTPTVSVRRAPHRLAGPLPEGVIAATLERPPRRLAA